MDWTSYATGLVVGACVVFIIMDWPQAREMVRKAFDDVKTNKT